MSAEIIPFRKRDPEPVTAIEKRHTDWMRRQREKLGVKLVGPPEPPEAA
jgi:hypothetical protein